MSWTIDHVESSIEGVRHRVSVRVQGTEVWFESEDARLVASPEAFAGAFLLPALHAGETIEVDAPVDATWLHNIEKLPPIYHAWWNYPNQLPIRCVGDPTERIAPLAEPARRMPRASASFFTGGVDSFHTVLATDERVDTLVYVHGYDIPLRDTVRMDHYEASFREAARQLEKRSILLRTNLREHPLFAQPTWHRTHGAGLAAAAHLLAEDVESFLVSSSYRYESAIPWGSHWETDHLWSSGHVRMRHGDASLRRECKVEQIAPHRIIDEHLRVCLANRSAVGNCSRCEKCLRTMVALEMAGVLERSRVFDRGSVLAEKLDATSHLPERIWPMWVNLMGGPVNRETREAIGRLLRRSRRRKRLRRAVKLVAKKRRRLVNRTRKLVGRSVTWLGSAGSP